MKYSRAVRVCRSDAMADANNAAACVDGRREIRPSSDVPSARFARVRSATRADCRGAPARGPARRCRIRCPSALACTAGACVLPTTSPHRCTHFGEIAPFGHPISFSTGKVQRHHTCDGDGPLRPLAVARGDPPHISSSSRPCVRSPKTAAGTHSVIAPSATHARGARSSQSPTSLSRAQSPRPKRASTEKMQKSTPPPMSTVRSEMDEASSLPPTTAMPVQRA